LNILVEEFNTYKETSKGLEEAIKKEIKKQWDDERNILEGNFYVNINGVDYGFISIEEGGWEDDGKYSFTTDYFQLVSFNCEEIKYPCCKNIIDKLNFFASVDASRTGSYYTGYYYNYDEPEYFKGFISHVPEVVIPAHDTVDIVKFK